MDEIIHYDNLTELLSPGVEMKTRIENAFEKVLDDHKKTKKVLDECRLIVRCRVVSSRKKSACIW